MKTYNVAVVGATGMVGRKMLEVLAERKFPVNKLIPFASKKSAGSEVEFGGKKYKVVELNEANVKANPVDFAIFSAGGSVSKEFAPVFASCGGVVIDNSSCWRMDETVPLVVPEVNPDAAFKHHGIIANPNCSTIQAMLPLKAIDNAFKIKRIVYTTFQAVSGAGVGGYSDLENGIKGVAPKKFPKPIAYNVLPHIDVFEEDGYTKEEHKMINETRKILENDSIAITATTVRVPVYYGHSESINVETFRPIDRKSATETLAAFGHGLIVMDDTDKGIYPTALDAAGHDEVYVGRIRTDASVEHGINFWCVADNIRKGAASNAVQIAELLIAKDRG